MCKVNAILHAKGYPPENPETSANRVGWVWDPLFHFLEVVQKAVKMLLEGSEKKNRFFDRHLKVERQRIGPEINDNRPRTV
jgi:hypothetical protein